MTVSIMQPYFFPYLGYFSLIKHADLFITLDEVQFIRHGWIDRNRILKYNGGWQYINCPLKKHSREILIKDLIIRNDENWQGKILAQLTHYKKKAPFYGETINLINKIFELKINDISTFNTKSLQLICNYLDFDNKIVSLQDLNLSIEIPNSPDEWALNICNAMGGIKNYINPIGGKTFFDKKKYDNNNVNLFFQNFKINSYTQKTDYFEPGLSIIDVLMFNSKEDINKMLDNYEYS